MLAIESHISAPPPEPPRRRLTGIEAIPPLPAVAIQVLSLLLEPDPETDQLAGALQTDPAFSAELLRLANSPLFGAVREVKSVPHAITMLGRNRLRGLTLTVAIRSYLMKEVHPEILQRAWWHSIAAAIIAEQLSQPAGMEPETAYAAGLLHDAGRLGLIAAFPAQYADYLRTVAADPRSPLDLEREFFGLDHCEAGILLAEEWRLPPEISLAAARHHGRGNPREPMIVTLIRFSCGLAEVLGFGSVRPLPPADAQRTLHELGDVAEAFWHIRIEDLQARLDGSIREIALAMDLARR